MEQMPLIKNLSDFSQKEKLSQKTIILSALEDCHNYIYANEGILKEKAFREIIKILFMKIYSEKAENSLFQITEKEYKNIFLDISCESFKKRVKKLYCKISERSSLNVWNEGLLLSVKTIAYIIDRLQSISLKKTVGDISGQAFQTFIHSHQRGERGEFFTPSPVVELAVNIINPRFGERIIDPACGSGGFLLSAIKYVGGQVSNKKLSHYIKHNIHGIEFNPDVALTAKLLIEMEGGRESNIICANSLSIEEQHGSFDITLANPPFGRRGKVVDPSILNKYDLGKKWRLSGKNLWCANKSVLHNQPPEILFIEKCLKLLRPEGRMAIVVPDGLLQNSSLAFVRHWIKSRTSVIGIISLPQETFMPFGTGVKTSLIFLRKNFQKKNVFFSKIKNIGYDVKGNIHYKQPVPLLNNKKNIKTGNFSILQNINSDIDQVVKAFHNKKRKRASSIAWELKHSLLKDRWDAEHYSLNDLEMISHLDPNNILSNFVEIVRKKEDFSKINQDKLKYIAISDIDRYGMRIANHQKLCTKELPSRASYKIIEGDILLAVSGANTGTEKQAVAIVTKDYNGAICSNGFAVLRNTKNINKYYLLAFFKTGIFIKQVRRMMTGHAIPCISLTNLGNIIIPIPKKNVQNKIAEKTKRIIKLSQIQNKELDYLKKEAIFNL